jgi:hypothetical protein
LSAAVRTPIGHRLRRSSARRIFEPQDLRAAGPVDEDGADEVSRRICHAAASSGASFKAIPRNAAWA